MMEDISVLGPGVQSLATPCNREGQFEACLFLLWKVKWHLCTHAHVYACSVRKCMQKHPQCLVWQSPKVCLYFCMTFYLHNGIFFCAYSTVIFWSFPAGMKLTFQKKQKREKRHGKTKWGKYEELSAKGCRTEISFGSPFPRKPEWSNVPVLGVRFPWHGRAGCLGNMSRNAISTYIAHLVARERGWFRVSRT